MHSATLIFTLQTLNFLLVVFGSANATRVRQNGCYMSNVILNCTHFTQPKPDVDLRWYSIKEGNKMKLARIYGSGAQRIYKGKPELRDRLTLSQNGSLEISSLLPDDEGLYLCIVRKGLFEQKTHQIQLRVACGKITSIKREVCVEEDVVLECDAMHRTVPSNRERVTWKKRTALENGSSYSRVELKDGLQVHDNGSLLLPKGREVSNDTYKCHVKKTDRSSRDEHIVETASIKCKKDTKAPAIVKHTMGRAAMISYHHRNVNIEFLSQETSNCGGLLNNTIGGFQSPNFPGAYPSNSHCQWIISVPQDYAAINITFDHVDIEHEYRCQYDYITIYDQLGNQIGCRICDTGFPRHIQVKGKVAMVTFHSDTSVNKTGFKINYKSVRTIEKS